MVNSSQLDKLDCVIVPATAKLDGDMEDALCDFYRNGGKLIIFGKPNGAEKLLALIGYVDLGASEYDIDYIKYECRGIDYYPESPILMYKPAHKFKLEGKVLVPKDTIARTEIHLTGKKNPNTLR